ncbi:DUF6508 domain-containing protein [Deinococcus caeni]|uniref:Uncharacterized protein n=1 Tax=Deinococcus caeni TaxID=569127 RepID=A0ABP9UG61_9DEIO
MSATYGPAALKAIADFLPIFEAPEFKFSHNDSPLRQTGEQSFEVVGYTYDPQVYAFWDAAEDAGWLQPFDWMSWSDTDEAIALRYQPDAISQATPEQLSRLLTMFVRAERFGDGAWLSLWQSGVLIGILRRAAILAEEGEQ